ncbi:aldehyde dehydrogenase [Xylariaceae sp. FL1272]|nr:aldehyde dehydrogenase [Xylariaceae sp. FL1272]
MAVNVDLPLHIPTIYDLPSTPQFNFVESPVKNLPQFVPLTFNSFTNVIDGELSDSKTKRSTINPSTLETNPEVPVSTKHDVDKAVVAAQIAFETWSQVSWDERRKAVEAFADALDAHATEFGHIAVREMGLSLAAAIHDVHWGVEWLHDFCKLSLPDRILDVTCERHVIERYTPLGACLGIVPWNGPVILACGKIAPALLTGNTLILKPSPFAPYSILKMAELGRQFFPPGVLQALSGDDELGPWLTAHPGISKVSFTGSCVTGKLVAETCSKHLKRVSLELGGNDPAIVCADVDPKTVAPRIAQIAMLRSGQLCMAIKRVYVHESIYEAVLEGITKYVAGLKVGDGFDENVTIGPISNRPQFERVQELLGDMRNTGLSVSMPLGATKTQRTGFFIDPVVVDNPPDDARVVTEEPFGPILPVMKWSREADVIRRANDTEFGLGASVWSRDLVQAERIANRLQAGNIWVNTHAELQAYAAFACHKESGLGSELGVDGLKGWCNVQCLYRRALL